MSIRAAVSAGLAVAIAEFLKLPHPIYAMIGAVIVIDLSPAMTRKLGNQRLIGSALGALTGAMFCQFLPLTAWVIGFSVLVAMFLGHLLRMQAAARLSGYVCAIVLMGFDEHAFTYALFRLVETALGIVIAVLVSFVPKLIPIKEPDQSPGA